MALQLLACFQKILLIFMYYFLYVERVKALRYNSMMFKADNISK